MNRAMKHGFAIALVTSTSLAACKKKEPPYELAGDQGGLSDTVAIVNGTEIARKNNKFVLPANLGPTQIKTIVFRYQTPCGPHDVPNTMQPLDSKYDRTVDARPSADDGYLWEHLVIVDANGGDPDKLDVKVGKQALLKAADSRQGSTTDGWGKLAHIGQIFGPECGAKHDVTVNGTAVGALDGKAPAELSKSEIYTLTRPIFITAKSACYRLLQREVEYTGVGGSKTHGESVDQVFHGPGAFHLPALPDVFGKEPDDPNKPTGLFEVPCDGSPPADGSGEGSNAAGSGAAGSGAAGSGAAGSNATP